MRTAPSLRARALIASLRVLRRKQVFADPEKLRESVDSGRRHDREEPPPPAHRGTAVVRTDVEGTPCYTIRPTAPTSAKHVLYLHGGAYVHQIQSDHWKFARRLALRTGGSVTVPVYPLAPGSTAAETVPLIGRIYDRLLGDAEPHSRVLMGDSAGGALSLVLAERLRDANEPQPKEIVLLSPWLDATLTHPSLPALDRLDPYLSVPGLAEAARLYAGGLPLDDPWLSPVNGKLTGLGRLSLFAGTRDVLLADARRFRTVTAERGIDLEYWEYEGMIHAWMLTTLREARDATRRIAHLVLR
ncbi:alpha/beta hydrolase fold domain-containing protein [Amycolatopsis sp. YIM 10]|uniref:alpha/beta hydrolase fold domain-containing protein n=1 Tax=Amycolatopsis sp. YIM 10 TaxID=2653857 RepID=UPI00129033F6|nr:alpha/beta hydrolase [Amycolatopsis sp. YIM 10]QFU90459.1 Putative acetyl-hydrolase LipR precursor [Amycolatopsis sp. YIM 10]